jgi:phosphatidylserine/phosphatidylglycerophosphate/cardiolipin synthase-like enzyme
LGAGRKGFIAGISEHSQPKIEYNQAHAQTVFKYKINKPGVMKRFLVPVVLIVLFAVSACSANGSPTVTPPTVAPATRVPLPTIAPTVTLAPGCPCLTAYVLPDAGVKPVADAIDGAQRSVKLKMYLFTEKSLVDALKRAVARKVDTRLLMEKNPFGGGAANLDVFNSLQGTGVQVQWTDDNAYRYTHEKSLVIDDKVAYIMSHNFTRSSFASNREYGIVDTNAADVAEVGRVFEADWNHIKPDLSNPRLVWSPVNSRARILVLIDEAQNSIDIEQEEWQDQQIGDHLLAALKKGVKMRLVASPNDPLSSDFNEPQRADLRQAGAQVRYLRSLYMHAKMYLVDGKKAFVGSENDSATSLNSNRELGIIFDETNPLTVIAATFEKDFAAGANN